MNSQDENSPLTMERIPSALVRPVGAALVHREAPSRRQVLKAGLGIAAGAALGALDLLPFSRVSGAAAYTEYTTCTSQWYYSSSETCVPTSAYYGSDNCAGSWFKNTEEWVTDCIYGYYTINMSSCDGRNAWRWYSGSNYTKCSDGWKTSNDWCQGGTVIDKFSICRTYH